MASRLFGTPTVIQNSNPCLLNTLHAEQDLLASAQKGTRSLTDLECAMWSVSASSQCGLLHSNHMEKGYVLPLGVLLKTIQWLPFHFTKNKTQSFFLAREVIHDLTLSYLSDLTSDHCPLGSGHSVLRFCSHIQVQLCTPGPLHTLVPLAKIKRSSLGVCVPSSLKSLLKCHFIREAFPVYPQYHPFSFSLFFSCFLFPQSSYHHLTNSIINYQYHVAKQ